MLNNNSVSIIFLLWFITVEAYSLSEIDSLLSVIKHSDNIEQKADAYIKILKSIPWQEPDSTINYIEDFKKLPKISQYPEYLLQIEYYYGRALRAKGDYYLALPHFLKSYDISSSISDSIHAARAAYQYGIINLFKGNMTESLDYLSISYNYYSELGMAKDVADLNNAMASYYQDNNDIPKAINRYMMALSTYQSMNDSMGMANVHANLGLTYIEEEKYHQAEQHLLKQGHLDSLLKSQYGLGFYYDFMGYLKQSEKKYNEALKWYQDAINTRDKLSSHYNRCESNISMSDLLQEIGKYNEAIPYANEIFKYADVHHSLTQEQSAHKILSNCYEKLGQTNFALEHYKKYKTVSDSIYNKSKISALTDSEAKFKKQDLDREITILNNEKEVTELKLNEQKLIIASGIIGLIFLSLVSLLIIKLYKNIKSKNQIILSALKDKDILLREIHHRVKNNLQIISSLLSLQSRQISDIHVQQAINEGRNRVRSMALIHQNLYQNENLTGVDVHSYLQKLISELFSTYNTNQNNVSLALDVDNLNLDVDTMIPLGLVINELVSNSLKHAFIGLDKGKVTVSLQEDKKRLILKVSDNGIGMQKVKMTTSKSFGNRLIKAFAQKLKAELRYELDSGTSIVMIINNYLKAA
ncbi:ATP-binding protein, partial [Saprospiraceae bacterium]|nr:ATP-binding protein [Saprospiraceae bacterium]